MAWTTTSLSTTASPVGVNLCRQRARAACPSRTHSMIGSRHRHTFLATNRQIDAITEESLKGWEEMMQRAEMCPPEGCLSEMVVKDIMTSPAVSVGPDDSFLTALQLIVEKDLSGLIVVDGDRKVKGVISEYDLLALDCTPGRMRKPDAIFPSVSEDMNFESSADMWREFQDRACGIEKETGRKVGEVMHKAAVIFEQASIDDAADIMVQKKIHRIAVVDKHDRLVGMITRRDILKATYANFKWYLNLE